MVSWWFRLRLVRGLILVLALAFLLAAPALAQSPARERAFVYGVNAALARSFTGSFVPPSVSTIYLLADTTSILSPRLTEIYFWPITNEYQASWETLNQPVEGTIEVLQGGSVIRETEATSYTIHYQPGTTESSAQLYVGDEADQAQAEFSGRQRAYQQALSQYYKDQQAWLAAADDANKRKQAGEANVVVPPAPVPPEQIGVISNGVNQGVPIKLPAGSYQIRVRDRAGAIVPGSVRAVFVFGPRRSSVGYMVLPETRWTTPDQVDDQSDVIVGKADSQLYLVPHTAQEFPARAYALLQNPQQPVGASSEWTWVMGEPMTDGTLEVLAGGQVADRRALTPFRVQQTQGSTLGYEVQEFVADPAKPRTPDFVGFPIRVAQAGQGYQIRMLGPDGQVLAGSEHLVRTPTTTPLALLLLLSAAPLAVGAAVIMRRRARMRLPRNIAG